MAYPSDDGGPLRATMRRLLQASSGVVVSAGNEDLVAKLEESAESGDRHVFMAFMESPQFSGFVPRLDERPFYHKDFLLSASNHNLVVKAAWRLSDFLRIDRNGPYSSALFVGMMAMAVKKANANYAFDGGVAPFDWSRFWTALDNELSTFRFKNVPRAPGKPPGSFLRDPDEGPTDQPLFKRRPPEVEQEDTPLWYWD